MPETVDPQTTAFAAFLTQSAFPVRRHDPEPVGDVAAARRRHVGRRAATASRWSAPSAGVYFARQNMLSQVGTVTTNGLQQQTIFVSTDNLRQFGGAAPVWPGVLTPHAAARRGRSRSSRRARLRPRLRESAHLHVHVGYEQELAAELSGYADYTYARGPQPDAVPELQPADPVCCDVGAGTGNAYAYSGTPFGPQLDEVMVTTSLRQDREYNGLTLGLRKRFAGRLPARGQLRAGARQGRRLERARSVHRSQLQLLRSRPRLRALGSRHPAQGEFLRLFRAAGRASSSTRASRHAARSRSRRTRGR